MEKINKITISFFIALCAIMILNIAFFTVIGSEIKNERTVFRGKIEDLARSKEKIEQLAKELEESKSFSGEELSRARQNIMQLSSELSQAKKKNEELLDLLSRGESEAKTLKGEIVGYKEANVKLSKKVELLNEAFDDVKANFDVMINETERESTKRIEELNKRLSRLSKQEDCTSLGTIVLKR